MKLKIAREGEILGEFDEATVPEAIKSGRFRTTDHYFGEGMVDWRPLSDFSASQPDEEVKKSAPPPPKASERSEGVEKEDSEQVNIAASRLSPQPADSTGDGSRPTESASSEGETAAETNPKNLRRVWGWLWVFCMCLMLLVPLSVLYSYFGKMFFTDIGYYAGAGRWMWTQILLFVPFEPFFGIYSFIVGYWLYTGMRGIPIKRRLSAARDHAKAFIWSYFSLMCLLSGFTLLDLMTTNEGRRIFSVADVFLPFLHGIIVMSIWLPYWDRSKRVLAVYGTGTNGGSR